MNLSGSRAFASGLAVATCFFMLGCSPVGTTEEDDSEELGEQVDRLYQEGRIAEAIPLATRLLEKRKSSLGPEHPDVATSLNNLAKLYKAMGDYERAEPLYERSLAIWERSASTD